MCREPILQSGENMKKNVLMENLIKSKFPKEYEEKLKAKKLAYEAEFTNSDPNSNSHFSFPAFKIHDNFIWPGQIKKIRLENAIFYSTIRVSSVNDRSMVLIPFEDFANKICCLCELQNISFDDEHHTATFDLVGKIRFKTITFQNMNLDSNNPEVIIFFNLTIVLLFLLNHFRFFNINNNEIYLLLNKFFSNLKNICIESTNLYFNRRNNKRFSGKR